MTTHPDYTHTPSHTPTLTPAPTVTVRATVTRPVLITDTVTVDLPADLDPDQLHSAVVIAANSGEGEWAGENDITYGDDAWELDTPTVTIVCPDPTAPTAPTTTAIPAVSTGDL